MANELRADLAVVTGDIISAFGDPLEESIRELGRLRATAGILGCHGNHEVYARCQNRATRLGHENGIHFLRGEATALRFRPGPIPGERLCYSGDLFRLDEEGFFYFISRKDDIIKCRGEKVAPKEVENVLYMLPGVTAVVVGVPDPISGEAVKAFIVSNGSPLTESQVIAHCRAHLEDFMVPKYVEFRTELPMTSSGKISKRGLS